MLNLNTNDYQSENILTKEEAIELVEKLKQQGKKVGLVKGSFDLLHPGHIAHIEQGKKFCDVLFVAIASDNFATRKNDNNGRPIYSDKIRAYMVSKLKSVDFIIFDEDGVNDDALYWLKPDVCIRGADHKENPDMQRYKEFLESYNGKIEFVNSVAPRTTEVIEHIKKEIKEK